MSVSALDPGVGVRSGWERRRAADLPSSFPRAPLGGQLEAVAPAPQDRRLPKTRGRPGARGLGVGSAPPSHPRGPALASPWRLEHRSLLPPGLVKERAVFRLFFKYKPPFLIQQCLWGSCCVPGSVPLKPRSCRGRQGPCPWDLTPHGGDGGTGRGPEVPCGGSERGSGTEAGRWRVLAARQAPLALRWPRRGGPGHGAGTAPGGRSACPRSCTVALVAGGWPQGGGEPADRAGAGERPERMRRQVLSSGERSLGRVLSGAGTRRASVLGKHAVAAACRADGEEVSTEAGGGRERVAVVGTGRQWSLEVCFGAGGSRSPGCARPPEGSLDKSLGPLLTVQVLGGGVGT